MSDEERDRSMEGQFRALTELVKQLQADNERLKGGRPSPNEEGGERATLASGPERYIYLPRERKCPRFSGQATDPMPVREWVEEARRAVGGRHMSQGEQALFILDHLDGEAKKEIRFRPSTDRSNPDKILEILIEIFGCTKSFITLQKQFFQRKQLEGESVREFSHALLTSMEAIKCSNPNGIHNPDGMVRDQFVENVRDGLLRRELKRSIRLDPESSFFAIRSEAVRWVEEGEHPSTPRGRAYSCDSRMQVLGECSSERHTTSVRPVDDLAELKECFRNQQAQLNAILERLGPSSYPTERLGPSSYPTERLGPSSYPDALRQGPNGPHRKPPRFQPDGQPICLRCDQPGHIARFCSASSRHNAGPAGRRETTASSQIVEGLTNMASQQEN